MERPKFIKKQIFYDSRGSFSPLSLNIGSIQHKCQPKKIHFERTTFSKKYFRSSKIS